MFKFFKKKPIEHVPFTQAILSNVLINDWLYMAHDVKRYEKEIEMVITITKGSTKNMEKRTIKFHYDKNENLAQFEIDGHTLWWDIRDAVLRYRPLVDWSKKIEIKDWFHIVLGEAIWVEKEHAEHNLTPDCLSYAYNDEEGNYIWTMADGSDFTVKIELARLIAEYENTSEEDMKKQMHYIHQHSLVFNNFYAEGFEEKYEYWENDRRQIRFISDFYKREMWEKK